MTMQVFLNHRDTAAQRNTVLIAYLALALFSCKSRIDYIAKADFNYINGTSDPIKIALYGGVINNSHMDTVFQIPAGDTLKLRVDGESTSPDIDASQFMSVLSADSTKAVFHDTLCYKEYGHNGPILQSTTLYTNEKKARNYVVFYYRIDNALLNMATKCQ